MSSKAPSRRMTKLTQYWVVGENEVGHINPRVHHKGGVLKEAREERDRLKRMQSLNDQPVVVKVTFEKIED